jgi:hypothetical protein
LWRFCCETCRAATPKPFLELTRTKGTEPHAFKAIGLQAHFRKRLNEQKMEQAEKRVEETRSSMKTRKEENPQANKSHLARQVGSTRTYLSSQQPFLIHFRVSSTLPVPRPAQVKDIIADNKMQKTAARRVRRA